jgi:hypothetical protein
MGDVKLLLGGRFAGTYCARALTTGLQDGDD